MTLRTLIGIATICFSLNSVSHAEPNSDPLGSSGEVQVPLKRKPFVRLGKSSFVRLGRAPEFAAKYPLETLTDYPVEELTGYPLELLERYPELLTERMLRSSGFVRLGKSSGSRRSGFVRLGRPMDPWLFNRYSNHPAEDTDETPLSDKRSSSGGSRSGRVSSFVRLGKSPPNKFQQREEKAPDLVENSAYGGVRDANKRHPLSWEANPVLDALEYHSSKNGYGPKRYQIRL